MVIFTVFVQIFLLCGSISGYTRYTLDDPKICNNTIYLEDGAKSAAILKLTNAPYYDPKPMYCTVVFMVPMHHWSGLTGVFEEIDLRQYDERDPSGNILCLDYIMVKVDIPPSTDQPPKKHCGYRGINPVRRTTHVDFQKVLGSCPTKNQNQNSEKCHITQLTLTISIESKGINKVHGFLEKSRGLHRGFTFVATAYSYQTQRGESECSDGLKSCSGKKKVGNYHCIHKSLWCDGHVNCGYVENSDEINCTNRGIFGNFMFLVMGPWIGASFLILVATAALIYSRTQRFNSHSNETNNQESFEEAFELNSNVSSSRMAIQVRVVCNSHPSHSRNFRWKADKPPAYDSIYPNGPPSSTSNVTEIITTVENNTGRLSTVRTGVRTHLNSATEVDSSSQLVENSQTNQNSVSETASPTIIYTQISHRNEESIRNCAAHGRHMPSCSSSVDNMGASTSTGRSQGSHEHVAQMVENNLSEVNGSSGNRTRPADSEGEISTSGSQENIDGLWHLSNEFAPSDVVNLSQGQSAHLISMQDSNDDILNRSSSDLVVQETEHVDTMLREHDCTDDSSSTPECETNITEFSKVKSATDESEKELFKIKDAESIIKNASPEVTEKSEP